MKKRKFTAFWDLLIGSIVCAILFAVAIYILFFIKGDNGWNDIPWYYTLISAFCVSISVTMMFTFQKISIDLSCDQVKLFYFVDYRKKDIDLTNNWLIFPSEIESVELVKLSKEEIKKYTTGKLLFNKYLKIKNKYGNYEYVYVAHYSNHQIKKIIKLLTNKNS